MSHPPLRVAASRGFFKALNDLPERGRAKVHKFIVQFMDEPTRTGLNYERINGSRDPQFRSLRVDQDYRCIVRAPEKGSTYVLLWVDKHDDAYAWARRNACQVNRVSGALQIVDVEKAEQSIGDAISAAVEQTLAGIPQPAAALFAAIRDDDLTRLGVPPALLPSVRAVRQEDDLAQLLEWLPPECVDALILLADGRSLEEVCTELERGAGGDVDPADVDSALTRIDSQGEFIVFTDDEPLEAMLSAPMETWRVFLHPSQRRLVERHWSGPVRVLGGAGTGKTVAAMHRARWLAQQIVDGPETSRSARVLFTTFTRNLATDIRSNLAKICTPQQLQRIEVTHLDAWVNAYLRSQGLKIRQFDKEAREAAWSVAWLMAEPALGLDRRFYEEEWREVVLPQGCSTIEEYVAARRSGRGTRLNRQKRVQIWPVFDALRSELRQRGLWEPEEAKRAAADRLLASGQPPRYRAVIVDEAQDLDAAGFRLIRALAGPERSDDLFIVGDSHQRIYGRQLVLSQCGINVRGRSRKLRINYRTTEETRAWATAVLAGVGFDDLDGGSDSSGDYRSLLHGEPPLVRGFNDPAEEHRFLVELLRSFQQNGASLASTCLTAPSNDAVKTLAERLQADGIPTRVITSEEADDPSEPALRLATMHRIKGLEFDHMLIPGMSAGVMPNRRVLDGCPDLVSQQAFEQRERSLLHVAATRARKRLVVTYCGEPSSFLRPE
ncbi:MAG: UvrD-helicase domain-containing protein [Synechococcaceae cyanobacterium]|nr:UvrD-helicase domain-containing protein [Synechococcaceae cyanobacterium]